MAITFVQKRKNQKLLVMIFVVMILAIGFILIYRFFPEEEIIAPPVLVSKQYPKIRIDFEVLESPIFNRLSRPFPDLPTVPVVGEVGRENPFLSFEGVEPPPEE